MDLNVIITLDSSEQYEDIVAWCEEYIKPAPIGAHWVAWTWSGGPPPRAGKFYIYRPPTIFQFAREEDAIMFKLRWQYDKSS